MASTARDGPSRILALPVDYVPSHATNTLFSSLRQRRPPSDHDWPHNEFDFEPFVKQTLQIRLDSDDDLCPRFQKTRRCDWGSRCNLRHCVTPSPAIPSSRGRDFTKRTVCKHWLRGLCKKGDQCDYLHEYDLRRMPECRFYATFGFCNAADECLYVHIDPSVKRRECERYRRGFCPLVRSYAHPSIKATRPSESSRATTPLLTHRPLTMAEAFGGLPGIQELPTDPRTGRVIVPAKDWAAAAELRKESAAAARDGTAMRREMNEVQCYKCGEYNHFANACPNLRSTGYRAHFDRGGDRWR